MSFDVQDAAEELHDQLPDAANVTEDEIADELQQYADFEVQRDEALSTVRRKFVDDNEMDDDGSQDPVELSLDEVSEDGQPVTVTGRITRVFDDTHESVKQKGLVSDETGTVSFVEFQSTDHPTLEEDETYRFDGAITDEYNGNYSVKLLERTTVEEVDEEIDVSDSQSPTELSLSDLSEDGQSVTVTGEVTQVFDNPHEAFEQMGRLGDDTAIVSFKEFKNTDTDHPTLEEGETYRIKDAITDEYEGDYSVKLTEYTTVEQVDDDIEVTDATETLMATVVNIQNGSGLIKRCPKDDCTHTVDDRPCPDHGDVDGEHDLRIKAHADTGTDVTEVLLGRDLTEDVIGMTLDEAIEKARKEMDPSIIADAVREEMIGRYYVFTGADYGRFLVEEYNEMEVDFDAQADELLARAEEVTVE